jgi:very-short-patch-repair endonuclease
MELPVALARAGHLVSRQQLAAVRIGRHIVDRGIREGILLPVRPGWVATPQAHQLAIIAVLHGARLTGATALRTYGVWAGDDRRIHLQLPPNAHRVQQRPLTPIARFTSPKFIPRDVVNHWSATLQNYAAGSVSPTHSAQPGRSTQLTDGALMTGGPYPAGDAGANGVLTTGWRVSVADALIQFGATETDEQLVAAIESAVHEEHLSRSVAMSLFQQMPRRQRRLAARLNFLGESGMETIVRMRLESLGLRVTQQVHIGDDRVDLVIDGWLIIELDGDEWHNPVDDRIRTNRLIRAGYRMLRFGYKEIFERWNETIATILEMLGVRTSV